MVNYVKLMVNNGTFLEDGQTLRVTWVLDLETGGDLSVAGGPTRV